MTPCPRCGTPLADGARFCSACGLAVVDDAPREERRVVTILFADIVEYTRLSEGNDPETVKRIIDRAFEGLAEIVTVYGGRVDKILGDEIMAVFGAPQAHEDDPERAVRCALEMQRSITQYSTELQRERGIEMKMRVGINTGECVTGAIGGGDVYTVVGDAVNVASRLVKAARPGAVLVGPSTLAATQRSIEYEAPQALTVKGKSEAVEAAEAIRERVRFSGPEQRTTSPLVGREPELGVLRGLATIVARDRRPAMVTILGDAGMGKSRLVAEFAKGLREAKVLWGRSLPYGSATPSFAVEEMIRAAFDVTPTDEPAIARKKISDCLAAAGMPAETERILTLAGLRDQPVAARRVGGGGAGPAASVQRTQDGGGAVSVFAGLAERESLMVLVFQELHWAEQALLEMVGDLMRRVRDVPLLVLALGRAELADRTFEWPALPGSATLLLQPLPRDSAAELLDTLAGAAALHPSVRENVLDRAGGNPFFIEEFARLVLDRGGGGGATVPVTVQALVAARLDTLDVPVRRVAQNAAVAGERFWPEIVGAMEPALQSDLVTDAISELLRRDLIHGVDQPSLPGFREYAFNQTIVREVAYSALPKQVRADRHAAAGGWLQEVTAGTPGERDVFDLIAHHYERAALNARDIGGDTAPHQQKARHYLERAGDEAMSRDSAATAASFYERALAFAADDGDALHLRVHLGEAFVGSWNPAKAQTYLGEALAGARSINDRTAEGKALRLLGDLERMRGNHSVARIHLEEALRIAREIGDGIEEAEGLRSHGLLDLLSGRVPSAPLWFRQSLARYRELGDKRGEAWSLQNLGWASLMLGRTDEALETLQEGAEAFTELGDVEGLGWCMGLQSWTMLFQGRFSDAAALAEQLIDMVSSVEHAHAGMTGMGGMGIEIERILLAIVATHRLRPAEALTLAGEALPRFTESGSAWGAAVARYPIGVAQIMRCEMDAAAKTFDEAMEAAATAGDPILQGLIGFAASYADIESGNLERADQRATTARMRTMEAGVEWHANSGSAWIRAALLVRSGKPQEALDYLAQPSVSGGIIPEARRTVVAAEAMLMLGDHDGAVKAGRTAVEQSTGGSLIEVVWARRIIASAYEAGGNLAEALAEINEALALLAQGEWAAERVRAMALKAGILDEMGRHDDASEVHLAARALIDTFPAEADTSTLVAMLG